MESTLRISSSMTAATMSVSRPIKSHLPRTSSWFGLRGRQPITTNHALSNNGAISRSSPEAASCNSVEDGHRRRSSLESLFCYDKATPEEIIEKPIGLSLAEKIIGDNPRCLDCQAKGAVLCSTCSGSGLYVDSILESQGIIVKVRCLGCGGTGNIMCSECGGRGHRDLK
ncbi:Chaperone protein like [Actinidia chinensis var. chinensis]|uniref:Chaperone protein like n=1 Tax=Actinidia chinensis var. chinensis TaxID=1590841 RepID=A0A2R6R9Z8_ACTCC|nr:Chaperone protein like [Actinidia chinensis var. chinensis]